MRRTGAQRVVIAPARIAQRTLKATSRSALIASASRAHRTLTWSRYSLTYFSARLKISSRFASCLLRVGSGGRLLRSPLLVAFALLEHGSGTVEGCVRRHRHRSVHARAVSSQSRVNLILTPSPRRPRHPSRLHARIFPPSRAHPRVSRPARDRPARAPPRVTARASTPPTNEHERTRIHLISPRPRSSTHHRYESSRRLKRSFARRPRTLVADETTASARGRTWGRDTRRVTTHQTTSHTTPASVVVTRPIPNQSINQSINQSHRVESSRYRSMLPSIDVSHRSISINRSIDRYRSSLVSKATDGNEGDCGRIQGFNE